MTTRLSDLQLHDEWGPYFDIFATENFGLLQSGVINRNEQFDQMASNGGATHQMPFYDDLPDNDPNLSSDDPAATSTPDGISTQKDTAIVHYWNRSWSNMDLNVEVNPDRDDPMDRVFGKIGTYWLKQNQKALINSIAGVIADNVSNDGADLFLDISGNVGAAAILDGEDFIDAMQKLGDAKEKLDTFVCHSAVEATLAKQDLITYIPDSKGEGMLKTFMGKRVITDDACPVSAGVYDSYLIAEGAFAWGEGRPVLPMEVGREASAGNGAGRSTLHSRRSFILHPRGFRWTGASVAGTQPTLAEMALGANWDRVFPQKYARFVGLRSKIA